MRLAPQQRRMHAASRTLHRSQRSMHAASGRCCCRCCCCCCCCTEAGEGCTRTLLLDCSLTLRRRSTLAAALPSDSEARGAAQSRSRRSLRRRLCCFRPAELKDRQSAHDEMTRRSVRRSPPSGGPAHRRHYIILFEAAGSGQRRASLLEAPPASPYAGTSNQSRCCRPRAAARGRALCLGLGCCGVCPRAASASMASGPDVRWAVASCVVAAAYAVTLLPNHRPES